MMNTINDNKFDVIIVGFGLAGLVAAAKLLTESKNIKIAIVAKSEGATKYIDALNVVLPSNPYGDTIDQHIKDTLEVGYNISDKGLVSDMCSNAYKCIEFLQGLGVKFAERNHNILLRQASGSSFARSVYYDSNKMLGVEIVNRLKELVLSRNVIVLYKTKCCQLLVRDNRIYGITIESDNGKNKNIYANNILIAWGGVGNLYLNSTYPSDIDGQSLGMAYEAGVELIDLEFMEFEPLVIKWPPIFRGISCPTTMLKEGAVLLNKNYENILKKERIQESKAVSKSYINKLIINEIYKKRGSKHDGIYFDCRNIPKSSLELYKGFYSRLSGKKIDLTKELLEVGPCAHSTSGGIAVDRSYKTNIEFLYAAGEAVGGIHGACRLAGNAATQALVSGIIAAESILGNNIIHKIHDKMANNRMEKNLEVYKKTIPFVKKIADSTIGLIRNEQSLKNGLNEIINLLNKKEIKEDQLSSQIALSCFLMISSCLKRTETRGSHVRSDYPILDESWQFSQKLFKTKEKLQIGWSNLSRN